MKKPPHLEILASADKTTDPYWWVRLVASNGQVLFTSETYSSRQAAKRAAGILVGLSGAPPLAVLFRRG